MCQICAMNALNFNGNGDPSASFQQGFLASGFESPVYGGAGPATATTQGATGNTNIDGVLSGSKWSGGTISFSFPSTASQYEAGYAEASTFGEATSALKTATRYAMSLVSQYTNLATQEVSGSSPADIRSAFSDSANPTAYAYYPSNGTKGGDVWYGRNYSEYQTPVKGQYAWTTVLHELGHALGLKHGHETGGPAGTAMQSAYDQMAYSVMTYRSYQNGPLTGYTNETNGYAQTYMMYDIAALQAMYGANFNTNSGDTTYRWSPTTGEMFINGVSQGAPGGNRIFMTIWDGNGTDTYDFSNFTTNLTVDLRPGFFSITSDTQLANLGNGNKAPGNIFNALQYNGDARSLIEIAYGGSGNDTITGNAANNLLMGNGGNDTFTGGGGNDQINGGDGTDTAIYTGARASYSLVTYNGSVVVISNGTSDGIDTLASVELLRFSDQTINSSTAPVFKPYDYLASYVDLLTNIGPNPQAAWEHYFNFGAREGRSIDTFNNYIYLASFDDLISAFGANQDSAAEHYVRFGYAEGRGNRLFNFKEYGASYNDLLAAFGNNSEALARHYVEFGRNEGRSRDAFDNLRYIASYDDLINAFGRNSQAATDHYVAFGYQEGRNKALFDPIQYIASYRDLINVFQTDTAAAIDHFILYGKAEGRSRDNFNAAQYLANYADLRAAFGTNEDAATRHFIEFGAREGRTDHII